MTTKIKIILYFFFAAVLVHGQNAESIEKLLDAQRINEAKSKVIEWTKQEANNAEAYYYAGKVFSTVNSLDTALNYFKKGTEIAPKNPLNFIGLYRIQLQKKDYNGLDEQLEFIIDLAGKKNALAFCELASASIYGDEKYLSKVEEFADRAIKIDRKLYRIYLVLGDYYMLKSNSTAATENYQKAIDYENSAARAYVQRGYIYELVKNYAAATDQYMAAIKADSTFPLVYEKLAELNYVEKNYTAAIEYYEKFIKYSEPSLASQKRFATFLFQGKNYPAAIKQLLEITKKEPNDAIYLRLLAYSYYESNDSVNAAAVFEKFFATVEKDKIIYGDYFRFGKSLLKLGQDSLGIENLKNAYAMDSSKTEILDEIGKMYYLAKRWKDVIAVLELKLSRSENGGEAQDLFTLGRAYYFDSSYVKAAEYFQKMTVKRPKLIVGYSWLARTQSILDPESSEGLAKPAYEKIIELASADTVKYKKELIEAHQYLGYFYYLKEDKVNSKANWERVLALDPENTQAIDVLKELNK